MEKNKKRIILFLPGLGNGGAERVILRLLKYFIGQGYEACLVVASRKGKLAEKIHKNVSINYLDSRYSLLCFFKYLKFIKNYKPDAILATLSSAIIISGLASLVNYRRSYVLVIRVANIINLKKSNPLRLIFETISLSMADGIIFNSHGTKDSVEGLPILKKANKSIQVISNPVLDDDYQDFISAHNKQQKLPKNIVLIGRFVQQKQIDHAILAFKIIASRIDNVNLTIIGDGPQYHSVKKLIKIHELVERVKIETFCDDIPSLLMNSDCLINTSEFEGFGNIFIEGLAFCNQVVCYDSPGGASELLKQTDAKIVTQGDYKALADQVIHLLSVNKPMNKNYDFLSNYTQKIICKKYEDFIFDLKNKNNDKNII
jgi:glycosyltransferase involved in cell wall biosynthesis